MQNFFNEDIEKLKLLKIMNLVQQEILALQSRGYKGGISTQEINHNSFESLKQKDLYFVGECLDLTGELGGFNFQIVFSQAFYVQNP